MSEGLKWGPQKWGRCFLSFLCVCSFASSLLLALASIAFWRRGQRQDLCPHCGWVVSACPSFHTHPTHQTANPSFEACTHHTRPPSFPFTHQPAPHATTTINSPPPTTTTCRGSGETRAQFARRVARVQDYLNSDDFQAPDGGGLASLAQSLHRRCARMMELEGGRLRT